MKKINEKYLNIDRIPYNTINVKNHIIIVKKL